MKILTKTAVEGSLFIIKVSFFDAAEDGTFIPVTPNTVQWSLYSLRRNIVNSREDVVVSPSPSFFIVLSGDDLSIDLYGTIRYALIEAEYDSDTFGSNLPFKEEVRFNVRQLHSYP